MKLMLLSLVPFSILEAETESREKPATWSALATRPKPEGPDFEERFRARHFYLVSQGLCTRVPRESILHRPTQDRILVVEKPQGREVNWIEFLAANQSWLRHKEVTWPQVLGEAWLSPNTLKNFVDEDRLVVATYQGGPVTVLSPDAGKDKEKQANPEKK